MTVILLLTGTTMFQLFLSFKDDKPYHDNDHAGIAGKFIPDLTVGDDTSLKILDIRIEGTYAQQARLEFCL